MMRVKIVFAVIQALLCCTYGSKAGYGTEYEKNMDHEVETDNQKWKYRKKSNNFYSDVMEDNYTEIKRRRSVEDQQRSNRNKTYPKRNISRMHQDILTEVVGRTLAKNISTPSSSVGLKNTQVSISISIVDHHLLFESGSGMKR